jgi:hypothetical protein
MLRSRTLAVLAALLTLAMPASSLAQSAGDDQYSDPLKGQPNGGGGGSTGGDSSGGGSTPSAPTSGAGTDGTAPEASAAQSSNGELPRTGFDVVLTIELGIALLLTGVVAQRLIVLRDRREQI